jgi:UDP-N-acetylglucosamine 1-carboxyvinyltransferase
MKKEKIVNACIQGGKPLKGSITIAPNKNAILPAIAASILTDEEMVYQNVPMSPDVRILLNALRYMGAIIDDTTATIIVCCKGLKTHIVPKEHVDGIQAGYLFAGPLLARFGKAVIPQTSGCRLGYRGYEEHAHYFKKLGVVFTVTDQEIEFSLEQDIHDHRILEKDKLAYEKRKITYCNPFVTPTENILMLLAASSKYETTVCGIAQEPHVVQLLELLHRMGAHIQGNGSTITIIGEEKLKGATFVTGPDHVDYFGFAVLAAMTNADLLLHVGDPIASNIHHMNEYLEDVGIKTVCLEKGEILIKGSESKFDPGPTFQRADEHGTFKINPGPWPMFPVDSIPAYVAFSSTNPNTNTSLLINNWMYTDGFKYVQNLKEMGARVSLSDGQRVVINGVSGNPYTLNTSVVAPDVIEGARAVIMCALSGTGTYVIKNAQYILRRNPEFFDILKRIGCSIELERLESTTQ